MTSSLARPCGQMSFCLLSLFFPSCLVYDAALIEQAGGRADGSESTSASGGTEMQSSGGSEATQGSGGAEPSGTGGAAADVCPWDYHEPLLGTEPTDLIDDFDDGDNQIPEVKGRDGAWFSLNDGTRGLQSPGVGAWTGTVMPSVWGDADNRALHYQGSGFTGSGRNDGWHVFGTDLAGGAPYSLLEYDGLAFWARADCQTPGSEQALLRVAISDSSSEASAGAIDHPGIVVDLALSHEWRQIKLPFDNFTRRFGAAPAFDPQDSVSLYFSPSAEGALDVWIDDIVLYADE